MKLLLIAPTVEVERYPGGGYAFRIANYNLPYIAALIPPGVEIRVVDECVEPIDFNWGADTWWGLRSTPPWPECL
jgi:hypothetical protein